MAGPPDQAAGPSAPRHVPVMAAEVLELLRPELGQTIVDGTVGGGGHAALIAERLGADGWLIGLDRDPSMLALARPRIIGCRVTLVEANFADLRQVLDELGVAAVDGALLDLGISSDQLADESRGFSFDSAGPLDLRMNPREGEPAHRLVNRLSVENLAEIFRRYGEERFSRRIARRIVEARRRGPIKTSHELAEIIRSAVPGAVRRGARIDPATRVFQALRIAVNRELEALERGLNGLPVCLKPGGRAVAISFHSLEDRLVKQAFRNKDRWERLTRKPLRPTAEEVARNPRARSAKLRAATRATADER